MPHLFDTINCYGVRRSTDSLKHKLNANSVHQKTAKRLIHVIPFVKISTSPKLVDSRLQFGDMFMFRKTPCLPRTVRIGLLTRVT